MFRYTKVMNTIQYVVVNTDLEMSAGKAAAQVAHAVNLVSKNEDVKAYNKALQRTVIVLAGTADQIRNLGLYLHERKMRAEYVVDEGVNEIPTMTITALATEQFDIDDEVKRKFFDGFKLDDGHVRVKRIDRFGFTQDAVMVPGNTAMEGRLAFSSLKKASK